MKNKLCVLEIEQPIGTFYVGKIRSDVLIGITKTVRREENEGIQRELSEKRARDISKYCEDPDATFPTPIILAVNGNDMETFSSNIPGIYEITFEDNRSFAEIIDGQHRIEGIKLSKNFVTDLLVVLMFDLTEEEKAYVFSTINSTQTKVDKSLIYDLFDLSRSRSPYKTCHEIARILNSDNDSPFCGRLKMLGKKNGEGTTLSQGTFVNYLCRLISRNPQEDTIDLKKGEKLKDDPKLIFRSYFLDERDDIILKVLKNYFNAVTEVFPEEWNNTSKYILAKTTGYGAFLKTLPHFYQKGIAAKKLSRDYFVQELSVVKTGLQNQGIELTSACIPTGEHGQSYLAKQIELISSNSVQ